MSLDLDANIPMPVLLRDRPYVYSTTEKSRTVQRIYLFYPEDLVSAIYWNEEQDGPVNELVPVSELAAIRHRNPHLVARIPGVIEGDLVDMITELSELHSLLEHGELHGRRYQFLRVEGEEQVELAQPELRLNREPIELPLGTQSIADLLRHCDAEPLSRESIAQYLESRHTQNYPSPDQEEASLDGRPPEPQRIGYRGHEACEYVAAEQRLKHRIDLDMTETSSIFMFALFDGGTDVRIPRWLKDKVPRCLLPEFFSVERTSIPNMTAKIKNCFMQMDQLLNEDDELQYSGAGASAAVVVYLPSVRLLFLINLGLTRINLIAQRGSNKPAVIYESPVRWASDAEERARIERSGRAALGVGPASAVDGAVKASRAFGHFAFKSTQNKPYSRANGAVSAVPDVSTVRMAPGERMWLALGNSAALDAVDNEKLASQLYAEDKAVSAQARCRSVLEGADESSALLVTELCAGGTRQPPL